MLNETEIKLLRLALDSGAQPGEIANAALLLIRKLRKRQASVDDFKQHYPEVTVYQSAPTYGYVTMPFGKYKGLPLSDIPESYLVWVLKSCSNITPTLRSAINEMLWRD